MYDDILDDTKETKLSVTKEFMEDGCPGNGDACAVALAVGVILKEKVFFNVEWDETEIALHKHMIEGEKSVIEDCYVKVKKTYSNSKTLIYRTETGLPIIQHEPNNMSKMNLEDAINIIDCRDDERPVAKRLPPFSFIWEIPKLFLKEELL